MATFIMGFYLLNVDTKYWIEDVQKLLKFVGIE